MGVREVEVAGRKLAIHELDDPNDPATGRALTGSWLWDSALHLAEWMATDGRAHLDVAGKTVLELGSGTGLPGLAAAVLGAARVVLTDVAALLPALRRNAEANGLGERVEVRELEWGSAAAVGGVEVVVMSDLLYDAEEMAGLARTLKAVCGEATAVWAASELRESVGECLAALASEGFETVEVVEMSRPLSRCPEETSIFALYRIRPPSQNPNPNPSGLS